jgi:hypothetical protein
VLEDGFVVYFCVYNVGSFTLTIRGCVFVLECGDEEDELKDGYRGLPLKYQRCGRG